MQFTRRQCLEALQRAPNNHTSNNTSLQETLGVQKPASNKPAHVQNTAFEEEYK